MVRRSAWVIPAVAGVLLLPGIVLAFPEQGKWNAVINQTNQYFGVYKSVFKNTEIYLRVKCQDISDGLLNVTINWKLRETPCWEEYWRLDLLSNDEKMQGWKFYYNDQAPQSMNLGFNDHLYFSPPEPYRHRCDSTIHLAEYSNKCSSEPAAPQTNGKSPEEGAVKETFSACQSGTSTTIQVQKPVFTIPKDGVYLFIVQIEPADSLAEFHAEISIQIKGEHGFLSATDYPLFLFYGASSILYAIYGVIWLLLLFWHHSDIIRVQFWVGAVIFLGMVEMAVFYAEYYSINSTGVSVTGAVLFAEIVSCAKRTLARMLVVIVSIGFGIVKPRLGTAFHQIIVVGALYFGLASFEASLRVLHPVNGPSNKALMAGIPLSVIDAGIFYWIFQSLLNTTRTLRLRRNMVKLSLYRQFTNTLIFAVVASIIFMIWSIRYLKTAQCLKDWKEIWIDEAYWHMLFSLILLVIMVLWRPSNNNQRFSFSPLLDNIEDSEEEDLVVNAAFGGNMKLRPSKNGNCKPVLRNKSVEDELRWVEENLPADIGEGDLPALDSEEELISTKFELSKMQ